jgi:phytoene synthase
MSTAATVPVLDIHTRLFEQGSRTYYNATRFFPEEVRRKVTLLYAFVRKADSLVDDVPQDREGFERFCKDFDTLRHAAAVDLSVLESDDVDPVIAGFVYLEKTCPFDPAWADAFLYSMRLDLDKSEYNSLDETLEYIYGSAEVIGLFMARLMELPPEALEGAKMLGRAMQYINFLRDADEDNGLGRRYIPLGDSGLAGLDQASASKQPTVFEDFYRKELNRFRGWQAEADKAFRFIPRKYRIPIRTASDMYLWTAEQIYRDPWVIYQRQVKPHKLRIILRGLANTLRGGMPRKMRY